LNNAIVLSRKLYSRALKITIYFACAAGGPARTAPKGHVPLESPFPPAGGIWYGCCLRCAVPAPPERRRGGWLSSAELFDREYNGLSEMVPSVSKVWIEIIFFAPNCRFALSEQGGDIFLVFNFMENGISCVPAQ